MDQKVALLTYSGAPELNAPDKKLISLLKRYNIVANPVVWNDNQTDWTKFDSLIFRSTWDYYLYPEVFIKWLSFLQESAVKTINNADIIRWNAHKFYLKDLQKKGINIIPTVFYSPGNIIEIPENWDHMVIKPAISAGSYMTEVHSAKQAENILQNLTKTEMYFLIQEYFPEITTLGELSFIYFDGKFSHAVRKTPKTGDFRVQSQFGGTYEKIIPDAETLHQTDSIIRALDDLTCYARVDGVLRDGLFYLMELELIEPDLYLQFEEGAAEQFAYVIYKHLKV